MTQYIVQMKLGFDCEVSHMATVRALINKATLLHICDGKKVSSSYLIKTGHFSNKNIKRWLNVDDANLPTVIQAKKIASCLHVPFAGLYMNPDQIPLEKIPKIRNMRSMYGGVTIDDSALNIALLDLLSERTFLHNTAKELGINLTIFSASAPTGDDPKHWASEIRRQFEIEIDKQYKSTSARQFYLYLRKQIEDKGVFIHCFSDVSVDELRGVAIFDDIPIIGINKDDRPPAKSFSIIHELVHILKRESSLCNDMQDSYAGVNEEVFCNAVAGELLLPTEELLNFMAQKSIDSPYQLDDFKTIAARFSVSREVVVRRLLNTGRITQGEYEIICSHFKQEIENDREKQKIARQNGLSTGIPRNMSREAYDKTSTTVCKALLRGYAEDYFSKQDISHHLGINLKHIDNFLTEALKWNS